MKVVVSLMMCTLIMLGVAWLSVAESSAGSETSEQTTEPLTYPTTEWDEPLDIDPLPSTELQMPPEFPDLDQLRIIGRIADGILKQRTLKGAIPYWFCGEPYEDEAAKDLAMEVAYHVVRSAWLASDDRRTLNVWGWAGTLLNEAGMDLCTLGLNPRRTAYRLGLLKPRRLTVSHTKEEILRVIKHPRMLNLHSTYDLGMAQTLDKYYKNWLRAERIEGSPDDLLEWKGFYWQATYMHGLAIKHETDRPWAYWPGHKAAWKDHRVSKHARLLGATLEEIGPTIPGIKTKPIKNRMPQPVKL